MASLVLEADFIIQRRTVGSCLQFHKISAELCTAFQNISLLYTVVQFIISYTANNFNGIILHMKSVY